MAKVGNFHQLHKIRVCRAPLEVLHELVELGARFMFFCGSGVPGVEAFG